MFFNKKISLVETDLFTCFKDYHNHILYGVDDGVKEISESLDVLAYYEVIGVKTTVFTPHINASSKDWELITANFKQLTQQYKGSINLSLAAEYMIDSGFEEEIKRGLRPIKEDLVLVESSYLSKSINFEESLYEVMNSGFTPVIAHPERYLFFDYSKYGRLKDCDYQFQLNLLSLAGCYGNSVRERALKLLADGMYNLVGSDMHSFSVFQDSIKSIKLTKQQYAALIKIL